MVMVMMKYVLVQLMYNVRTMICTKGSQTARMGGFLGGFLAGFWAGKSPETDRLVLGTLYIFIVVR